MEEEHYRSLVILLSISAIHLNRDGCVLISPVQTLLDVTSAHGMSATAIRVFNVSPDAWIAFSQQV